MKVCLISLISCWHVTRLSRRSVRLMKERQSLHHSQSKVVCRNIFQLWLLENWNIRIDAYRQWRWNFLRKEKYQNTKWKTESYVFSGFSNGISRGCHSRLWPFTWIISSAGKDQFILYTENEAHCFCCDSTHVFILSAPKHFTICIRRLSIFLFSFIHRVDLSCQ